MAVTIVITVDIYTSIFILIVVVVSATTVERAYLVEIIMQFVVRCHSTRTQITGVVVIVGMCAAIASTATTSIP